MNGGENEELDSELEDSDDGKGKGNPIPRDRNEGSNDENKASFQPSGVVHGYASAGHELGKPC